MTTQRLELDDAYLRQWTSPITWLDEDRLTLERSAFYPGGGGQDPDRGTLTLPGGATVGVACEGMDGGQVVLRVQPEEGLAGVAGEVAEVVAARPAEGEFQLDWAHRYHAMRVHTAYHCVVGLAWTHFGAKVAGGGMAGGRGRIDFSADIDREGIEFVATEANAAIAAGAPVSVSYVPVEEALAAPELVKLVENRAPTTNSTHYRVVEIAGIDREIDGGTHVRDLAEVGGIIPGKISAAGRGMKRFKFTVE